MSRDALSQLGEVGVKAADPADRLATEVPAAAAGCGTQCQLLVTRPRTRVLPELGLAKTERRDQTAQVSRLGRLIARSGVQRDRLVRAGLALLAVATNGQMLDQVAIKVGAACLLNVNEDQDVAVQVELDRPEHRHGHVFPGRFVAQEKTNARRCEVKRVKEQKSQVDDGGNEQDAEIPQAVPFVSQSAYCLLNC